MPRGGPGEVRRRRGGGQQGAPRSEVASVGRAHTRHAPRASGAPRKPAGWTLDRLIHEKLGASAEGGGGGAQLERSEQRDDEGVGALATPQPQPAAQLHREPQLGQRTLAHGALGTVAQTPARADRARHEYLRPGHAPRSPYYAWLKAEQLPPARVRGSSKSEEPSSPPSVIVDSSVAVEDEPAEIVVVGGGPHALAALAALHDESSLLKDDAVCVIDPGSHFMQSWNARFEALEIKHLRSPACLHPMAFDPTALVDFAIDEGRTSELMDAPASANWLVSTDMHREKWLKALPTSSLFRDFCSSLESKLPHRWASGTATSVCKDSRTGELRVRYKTVDEREHVVAARAVILATGPVGKWNFPDSFEPLRASRLVLHTEQLIVESSTRTLGEEITRRCPSESARVLIIGGGISAAQAALAAVSVGHQVVLRSRRPLRTRAFDIDQAWFDMRMADRMRFEFLCLPMNKRLNAIRREQSGGSVPANYMKELIRISQTSSDLLTLEVDDAIDCSKVCVDDSGEHIIVNGETFALVILATGVVTVPSCGDNSRLYHSVKELLKAPTANGLPLVDSRLRWVPNEDIFVMGANAMLELGPGGGNLMGAMRGARVIVNSLHGQLSQRSNGRKARPAHKSFSNMYASLGDRVRFGDGCEAEIDFLAEQLHLTPQAEVALRRARGSATAGVRQKQPKATPYLKGAHLKGTLKGQRDPMGHLSARTRWATYW